MIGKKMSLAALCALMVFGAASAPAFADPTTPQQTAAPSGTINFAKLNLTSDQVKKLNILRLDYNKAAIKLKADIQLKQIEIQRQLMSPAVNTDVVRRLMAEKLAIDSQLQKLAVEQFLAFKKMLTPQQLALLPGAMTVNTVR